MKKYMLNKFVLVTLILLAALTLIVSPSHRPVAREHEPKVIMEVLDPTLYQFEPMWKDEISRRFDHAVGVLVHGGDYVEGQWIVGASLQPWAHVSTTAEIVRHFQQKYPDRTVVLLACNTGHLKLGIPGVYYAKSSVWCIPDRHVLDFVTTPEFSRKLGLFDKKKVAIKLESRWSADPDVVGNIYEFVTD